MIKGINNLIIIVGSICALIWGFITAMTFGIPNAWCQFIDKITFQSMSQEVFRMANGFYYDTSNNDMPTVIFLILFGIIFALVFILIDQIEKRESTKYSLKLIIFFSILLRIIILPGELIHENDIYRYIWDGKSMMSGVNPYKYAPADVFMYENGYDEDYYDEYNEITIQGKKFSSEDEKNLDILLGLRDQNPVFYERIGHWQVPTIYPPVSQVLFIIPLLINNHSLVIVKFFFVLFDIGCLFLIIALLKHFKGNPCMCITYGWSPLVLFEIANGGHYDSIPIFFTVLCLFFVVKRHRLGGACILAFATLSKFFSGFLLPILFRSLKIRFTLIFASVILLMYIPFFIWDQAGFSGVFQGLMTYNAKWSYNSSIFALIYNVLEKISTGLTHTLIPAKIVSGCIYLVILVFLTMKKSKNDLDILHKCFLSIAILFIMNPVADPWYFCWVIPFLCFFPYRSWYLLSGLLMLSYLNFHSNIAFIDIRIWKTPIITWITYVPFFIYLAIECIRKSKLNFHKIKL